MRKLFSFLVVLGLCVPVFADSGDLRVSVSSLRDNTTKSTTFAIAGTNDVTADSLVVKSSSSACVVYDASSSGAVDFDVYASFSDTEDGTYVGKTKIADVTSTTAGVAQISTFYELPYLKIELDGQGSNDASTTSTIKVGRR